RSAPAPGIQGAASRIGDRAGSVAAIARDRRLGWLENLFSLGTVVEISILGVVFKASCHRRIQGDESVAIFKRYPDSERQSPILDLRGGNLGDVLYHCLPRLETPGTNRVCNAQGFWLRERSWIADCPIRANRKSFSGEP